MNVKYEPNWKCKCDPKGLYKNYKRHNYVVLEDWQITCIDCGMTLLNIEDETRISLRNRELIILEKNKKAGDITIYRVTMRKRLKNGRIIWIPLKDYRALKFFHRLQS